MAFLGEVLAEGFDGVGTGLCVETGEYAEDAVFACEISECLC